MVGEAQIVHPWMLAGLRHGGGAAAAALPPNMTVTVRVVRILFYLGGNFLTL